MLAAARIALLLLLASCIDLSDELVVVSPEPAGANCAEGGSRIDSGPDHDGDGELDADEIDATGYECDGTDDAAGTETDGVGTSP